MACLVNYNSPWVTWVGRYYLRTPRDYYRARSSWKLAIRHMIFKFTINRQETVFNPLFQLMVVISSWSRIFLFLTIILLNQYRKRYFDKATYLSTELAVAIANSKDVKGWIPSYIWSKYILILINFIWVVRVIPNPSCKSKFSHTILTFLVLNLLFCLFFSCIIENWWISSRWILTFWHLLFLDIFVEVHLVVWITSLRWAWRRLDHSWWLLLDHTRYWILDIERWLLDILRRISLSTYCLLWTLTRIILIIVLWICMILFLV